MSRSTYLDPVVEEVRERGRRFTQRFGNDVRHIFEHFNQQAARHPERYVSEIRVVKAEAQPCELPDTSSPPGKGVSQS